MRKGFLFVLAVVIGLPTVARAQGELDEGPRHPAEEVVLGLVRAIDYFDLDAFVSSFSEEATVFYPITGMAERVEGQAALATRQKMVFESLRKQFKEAGKTAPPFFNLVATDMRVQVLGEGLAVVTYHVDRGTHLGRRTAVVQEQPDGMWRIVSFHSSNMDTPTSQSNKQG